MDTEFNLTTNISENLNEVQECDNNSSTTAVNLDINKSPTSDSCISDIDEFLSEDSDSSDNEDLLVKRAIKNSRDIGENDSDSDLDVKVRTFVEETLTKTLVRKCWKCRRRFIKEYGCNEVTCVCGAITCYHCRHAVTLERASVHVFCPVETSALDDSRALAITGRRLCEKVTRVFPHINVNNLVGN